MPQATPGEQFAADDVQQPTEQTTLEDNLVGEGAERQPEPKAEEPVQEEVAQEPEEEAETEQSSNRRPRRGGFQKKIERLAAENAALKAQLANAAGAPVQKESVNAQGEPRQEDFTTFEDYNRALIRHEAAKIVQQQNRQRETETIMQAHNRQVNEARAKYQDFDEAIADYGIEELPSAAAEAILHSGNSAEIAYYLATNPEGDELFGLNGIQAAIRIGEINAKIKSGNQKAKAAPKISKAPPPITPIKAKSVVTRNVYNDELSYEEFREIAGRS